MGYEVNPQQRAERLPPVDQWLADWSDIDALDEPTICDLNQIERDARLAHEIEAADSS